MGERHRRQPERPESRREVRRKPRPARQRLRRRPDRPAQPERVHRQRRDDADRRPDEEHPPPDAPERGGILLAARVRLGRGRVAVGRYVPTNRVATAGAYLTHDSPEAASIVPSRVSWRGSPNSMAGPAPWTGTTQTWNVPPCAASTARLVPSGDQTGLRTYASLLRRASPPPGRLTP